MRVWIDTSGELSCGNGELGFDGERGPIGNAFCAISMVGIHNVYICRAFGAHMQLSEE